MTRFEPQPTGDAHCDDPTHDHACDCGAEPDRAYERQRGI